MRLLDLLRPHPRLSIHSLLNASCSYSSSSPTLELLVHTSFDYGTVLHDITSPDSCYSYVSLQSDSQLVDRNSGVVFQSVSQGSYGVVSLPNINLSSLERVPPPVEAFSADTVPLLPVIALTVPTPVVPPSPVFVPQSPLSLSKFVAASERFMDHGSPMLLSMAIPLVPDCDECLELQREHQAASLHDQDVFEYQSCRACYRQWLACQVWYQASDGGRMEHLREPFIKPGETNASNRAMIQTIGFPASPTFTEPTDIQAVIEIRDVSDSVGFHRRIGRSVKSKFRKSLKRARRRFSDDVEESCATGSSEMGQIRHSCPDAEPSRRRLTVWNSVTRALRLRRK